MVVMEKVLDKLGFSEYKKKTYLALVRMERAKVRDLVKATSIPSSKIYEILNWLYSNGYISIVSQEPLIYRANDPKNILQNEVRARIDKLKDIESEINKINTGLPLIAKADFQILYGRDAFFNKVKESVAKSNKSVIAVVKNWRIDYDLKELTGNFVKNGGKARFLGPINKDSKKLVSLWNSIGVLTKNHIPDSTRFTVWDGKIITLGLKDDSSKEYYSLWIENEYLGKILTQYFDKMWLSSGKRRL